MRSLVSKKKSAAEKRLCSLRKTAIDALVVATEAAEGLPDRVRTQAALAREMVAVLGGVG